MQISVASGTGFETKRENMSDNTSAALIVLNQSAIQQGGLGVDLGDKLFQLEPATISITKDTGRYKINDTGDTFEEMFVTLLSKPEENRSYYIGDKEDMNRTAENLVCFSTDMIEPSERSKIMQAPKCEGCPRSSWESYRKAKADGITGKALKALIPPCEAYYRVDMIDTVYKMPLRMYVRSTRRDEFEKGMKKVARQIMMMRAQGKNPNIFDVRFKLGLRLETRGNYKYHVPVISDVKAVTDEERLAFGEVYLQYINYQNYMAQKRQEKAMEAEVQAANEAIDASVVTDTAPGALDGEYVAGPDGEIQI